MKARTRNFKTKGDQTEQCKQKGDEFYVAAKKEQF